jgi:hypothetical protein
LRLTPIGIAFGFCIAIEESDAGDAAASVMRAILRPLMLVVATVRTVLLVALLILVAAGAVLVTGLRVLIVALTFRPAVLLVLIAM